MLFSRVHLCRKHGLMFHVEHCVQANDYTRTQQLVFHVEHTHRIDRL